MIDGLLDHVARWSGLGFLLLVFGFAPGFVLRIIVLAYHRDDPRRRELLGELYEVARWERPFWVCQQIETAMFEGSRLHGVFRLVGRGAGQVVKDLRNKRHLAVWSFGLTTLATAIGLFAAHTSNSLLGVVCIPVQLLGIVGLSIATVTLRRQLRAIRELRAIRDIPWAMRDLP